MGGRRLRLKEYLLRDADRFYLGDFIAEGEGTRTGLHRHDFYEIYVVLSGELLERTSGGRSRVGRRQAHLLGPEDEHDLCGTARKGRLRNLAIRRDVFEDTLIRSGLNPERLRRYFVLDADGFRTYQHKTELAGRLDPLGRDRTFLLQSVLDDLLIACLLQPNSDPDIPPWLSRVYRAMEEEENYVAGLPRMVELAGKSQEYLTRCFGLRYGMTPSEYVNLLRLQAAAWRLQNTQERVIDIAYQVGFNNVSYFNRLFRERYRQTPLEYRNKKMF